MSHALKAISFLPLPLLPWIESGILERRFPAVVAFADVSGFTAMSEKLASIGREGAETLTSILNSYFTEMIGRIESAGGFVGKFGGDAMTIFFPADSEDELAETARRAVSAMVNLQSAMKMFTQFETKVGTFSLGMKIGVASGMVLFKVVGEGKGGREFLLAGLPLDSAAEAEHHGAAGDVILTETVFKLSGISGKALKGGYFCLTAASEVPASFIIPPAIEAKPEWAEIAGDFIDPAVARRLVIGLDSVGEIRRVSVIFMSFAGLDYTSDDSVGNRLDQLYNWVYRLTSAYGGSINKVDMGDKGSKMIITFGTPTAHENDEQLAVHCGLELVRGTDELRKLGLEQHVGIASGVVFAGEVGAPSRQEYTVMGRTVNLAARLMAHSQPGQLVIDEATRDRCLGMFEFSPPNLVQFKGVPQPLPVFTVLGLVAGGKAKAAQTGKLIGRQAEISRAREVMKEVWSGKQRTLIIRGDPGTGKSRLVSELIAIARAQGMLISAGEALSYAKRSPYLIWISILRRLMKLPAAGGGGNVLKHLNDVIAEFDPDHLYRLPIVAALLGIECEENETTRFFDAQLRQENLFDFLVQFFRALADRQPLFILFEDVQWIDRNSLELAAYLSRNLTDLPVLFVLVRRPYSRTFTSPFIGEIEGGPTATSINLTEFDRSETEQFVLLILGARGIDPDLMKFIFDSSHGNPSFTEQLVQNLKSLGKLRIVPDAVSGGSFVEKVGDLSDVQVPDSLSSLIMSQLDRLGPEAKLTVKLAAVVGRGFGEEIISGAYPVAATVEDIRKTFGELKSLDIIKEIHDADFFNYIFKNLLTRDVAYDSLLFAHRREYHRRVGLCLEELHKSSLKEWFEELARHFYQSEDDERASKYLLYAGDKAFDIYANESAEDYYTKALERCSESHNPEQRYRLLTMRASVFAIIGKSDLQKLDLDEALQLAERRNDYIGQVKTLDNMARYFYRVNRLDDMKEVIDRAQLILAKVDYPIGRVNITSKTGTWHFVQNRHREALESWLICRQEAERHNDTKGLSSALTNCGLASKALGDLNAALDYYNSSVALDRSVGNKKSEAVNLGNIGVLHHQRGDMEKALEAYQAAIDIARSIGSKQIQSYYLGNLAVLFQARGERERALKTHQDLLEITRRMGYLRGQVLSLGNIGTWYHEDGDFQQAISHYEQALAIAREIGLKGEEPRMLLNLGQTYQYMGKLDRAIEHLQLAVKGAAEVGSKPAEDYARRYLGFALIEKGQFNRAMEEFVRAAAIATSIGSKVGMASAKIGLAWAKCMKGEGDIKPIEDGIKEAQKIGDVETIIKGKIALARSVAARGGGVIRARILLAEALETAKASGFKCDVKIIEPILQRLGSGQ